MNSPEEPSLRWLLAGVTIVALGCVALVYASPWVATLTRMLASVLLLTALLGAAYRDGAKRAFWIGFAVFGIGYDILLEGDAADVEGLNRSPALVPLNYLYGVMNNRADEVGPSLDFYYVGNSLFVILLALAGGALARWLHVTRGDHEG